MDSSCLLCNVAAENLPHLFFGCAFASQVWLSFFNHHSLSPPSTLNSIIQWVKSAFRHKKVNKICKLVLQAVIYEVWKERNARLHLAVPKPVIVIVKEIQLTMRKKLATIDTTGTEDRVPSNDLSICHHGSDFSNSDILQVCSCLIHRRQTPS